MNNNNKHTELIAKYLAGEATTEEIRQLEAWKQEDTGNLKAFEEMQKVWDLAEQNKNLLKINVNNEWKIFEQKLEDNKKEKTIKKIGPVKMMLRIAAVFLLLVGISTGVYLLTDTKQTLIAETEPKTYTLPDKSEIILNKDSKVTYKNNYGTEKRGVVLKGDAYFDVEANKDKPFIVETKNVIIEVVGTAFYVNAGLEDESVSVIVEEGSVAMYPKGKEQEKIILNKGDKGTFTKDKQKLEKARNLDVNFLSWKTKKIMFRNKKLSSVVAKLNHVYDAHIKIANTSAKNCRITVSFDDQSLDAILKVLESTLDITIKKYEEKIIIKGKGC
jgi:ferric-dicitrate binding protein FerR (iron transport regulator)